MRREVLNMKIVGLRLLGIWSLDPSNSSSSKLLYYFYCKTAFAMVLIFVGTLIADLIHNYNNLLIITDDGCYLAGISVIVFKLYTYQTQHKRISKLVNSVHGPLDILCESSDSRVLSAIERCTFYENLTGKFFLFLGGILAVFLIFFVPKTEGALPIRAIYPFDVSASPMHELAISIQAFSITYGLLTIVLMDELVITLIRWINLQLSILGNNYENCSQKSNDNVNINLCNTSEMYIKPKISSFVPFEKCDVEKINDSFIWRFKTSAKYHQKFINIVDELNKIFGSSMLVQLFASFAMICLTAFQATLGTGEKKNLMKFIIYLGAAFSQLLNWCWFGNELLYQSTSLTTSQWLCGWQCESHPDIKTFMVISLMRTKHPLQLKAGKFYNMSLQTFITVLRSSYSFFTLLSHVTSDI